MQTRLCRKEFAGLAGHFARALEGLVVWGLLLSTALGADPVVPTGPVFPLKVSANQRFLEGADGTPFLYHADTAWMLLLQLNDAQAEEYFITRKAQGFNVIQLQLTGFLHARDQQGELPFLGDNDLTRPNPKFFDAVATKLEIARKHGLLIALAPAWSGCCGEGWTGLDEQKRPKPLNQAGPDACKKWGRWLGERYGDFDHLLWILGGDNDPDNAREEIRALGQGLHAAAPHQLITYHAASTHSSTDVWPADESWLGVSMVYTYFRGFNKAWNRDQPDVYEVCRAEWPKTPTRPFFLGESTYEGEHGDWGSDLQARKNAYWSLLSGGCGHAYGSPNWKLEANWRDVAKLPGAESLKHCRRLFESRPWWELVPDWDQRWVVNAQPGYGQNNATVTAATADQACVLIYLPESREVTVDLSAHPGSYQGTWFDPRSGATHAIDRERTQGKFTVLPPAAGDWVLVLDLAERNFGPPDGQ